jgi:hypothetical protein
LDNCGQKVASDGGENDQRREAGTGGWNGLPSLNDREARFSGQRVSGPLTITWRKPRGRTRTFRSSATFLDESRQTIMTYAAPEGAAAGPACLRPAVGVCVYEVDDIQAQQWRPTMSRVYHIAIAAIGITVLSAPAWSWQRRARRTRVPRLCRLSLAPTGRDNESRLQDRCRLATARG